MTVQVEGAQGQGQGWGAGTKLAATLDTSPRGVSTLGLWKTERGLPDKKLSCTIPRLTPYHVGYTPVAENLREPKLSLGIRKGENENSQLQVGKRMIKIRWELSWGGVCARKSL